MDCKGCGVSPESGQMSRCARWAAGRTGGIPYAGEGVAAEAPQAPSSTSHAQLDKALDFLNPDHPSIFFFFNFYLFIYFMAVLGLRFCARALSSCGKRGPLFIAVRGPLTIAASLVAKHRRQTRRLSNCGSRA